MYLHLGNNKIIKVKDIIGIFDMDTSTVARTTKEFLKKNEREGNTEHASDEIPKSFVLTDSKIYTSQISPAPLSNRVGKL